MAADGGAGVGPLAMMTGADAAGVMVMLTCMHVLGSVRCKPTLMEGLCHFQPLKTFVARAKCKFAGSAAYMDQGRKCWSSDK